MDRVNLPDAAWRERPGLADLVEALGGGGDARFVGGAVRDTLLGLDVADVDIATRHSPDRVLDLLKGAAIKAVPTGLAHGTVTAVTAGGPVEVTTLRRDVATDGRHATVAFTDDWREDAARRDFTINALYADPVTGELFDYFGGLDDLAAARVRFIGEPDARIGEDHLRILRFFRFLARFGDEADAAALDACTRLANTLMALSRERIADELLKLLIARHAVRVVALMVERGILAPIIPEIDSTGADRLRTLAAREEASGIAPDAIRRLAALLPPEPLTGEAIGARLKLSKLQRRRLESALHPVPGGACELAYRIGTSEAVDRLLLDPGVEPEHVASVAAWPRPAFPLGGGTLVARGIKAGPEVARLRRVIEDRWIAEGFPGAARVDALVDEVLAQLRDADSSV